jgi:putative ABC transport system permease protein
VPRRRWSPTSTARGLYETARGLLSLFYAFVAVMLCFGGLMAFALLFNTASVNAGERAPELAALELNGTSSGPGRPSARR